MHNGAYLHTKWLLIFVLAIGGLIFWSLGCGKKGPPRPPQRPLPPVVKDLGYTVHDDIVELSWTVPVAAGGSASPPAAVKVFRSRLSAEEAGCQNCPIRYSLSVDIPIRKKRSEKSKPIRMRYSEVVEPGYRYVYKVIVFDEYGFDGRDSNVVKFDH